MSNHTPGPWIVKSHSFGCDEIIYDGAVTKGDSHGDRIICIMPTPHLFGENLANARLIAAAPDLLDALKALVDRDFSFLDGKMIDSSELITVAQVMAARLAIAKAEGGAG